MADDALIRFYELTQVKARYCRALDTKDWATLADLLTDDVAIDLAADRPDVEPIVGRDNVIAALRSSVDGATTVHQVHLPEFEFAGDEARVGWAVQERVVWDNGTSLVAYGRYDDRWVRSGGHWKMVSLRLTNTFLDFS